MARGDSLFPVLLKHWRSRRGLSQLDLALFAEVSARHLSFLETGRALPSREMVLRLGAALDVPLREQNALLAAAGFAAEFAEPSVDGALPAPIQSAIERMLAQQEPFPMIVLNRHYDIIKHNTGAAHLLTAFVADASALSHPLNVVQLLFDPRLCRRFVIGWERVARELVQRMYRESLACPGDTTLTGLVRSLSEYPDMPKNLTQPDLGTHVEPSFTLTLERGDLRVAFLTTMTVFSAPQNVTLEELRLESYFPLDRVTEETFKRFARGT